TNAGGIERLGEAEGKWRFVLLGGPLQKSGQKVDDVERSQLTGGDALMRQRAFDQFLEIFGRRLTSKYRITHRLMALPATYTTGGCKRRSDEFLRVFQPDYTISRRCHVPCV